MQIAGQSDSTLNKLGEPSTPMAAGCLYTSTGITIGVYYFITYHDELFSRDNCRRRQIQSEYQLII